MTINTDLLLQIREQITSHPETHDQTEWGERSECGTTHCIAGWAAVITGAALDWRETDGWLEQLYTVNDQDPKVYAAQVLGLSHREAVALFYELNDTQALRKLDVLIEKGKNGA